MTNTYFHRSFLTENPITLDVAQFIKYSLFYKKATRDSYATIAIELKVDVVSDHFYT